MALLVSLGAAGSPAQAAPEREDIQKPARLLGVDLSRTDRVTLDQKKFAKGVADDMVCLCGTCARESLATCDCSWAGQGRKMIELALLDGKSSQNVLDAFRQSFGDKAFAAPPSSVETTLTVIPYLFIAAMLFAMLAFGLRNRRSAKPVPVRTSAPEPVQPGGEDEAARILRRELEEMD